MNRQQIEERLLKHIQETYMNRVAEGVSLSTDTHLFREGIVDSIGVLMLVQFLEEQFKLAIQPDEMVLEHFDSIASMAELVLSKKEN